MVDRCNSRGLDHGILSGDWAIAWRSIGLEPGVGLGGWMRATGLDAHAQYVTRVAQLANRIQVSRANIRAQITVAQFERFGDPANQIIPAPAEAMSSQLDGSGTGLVVY